MLSLVADRRNYIMINLQESIESGRDRDPGSSVGLDTVRGFTLMVSWFSLKVLYLLLVFFAFSQYFQTKKNLILTDSTNYKTAWTINKTSRSYLTLTCHI